MKQFGVLNTIVSFVVSLSVLLTLSVLNMANLLQPCFYIGMFQIPGEQKGTDLVGRPIVHKSAFKQATGNFPNIAKKEKSHLLLRFR